MTNLETPHWCCDCGLSCDVIQEADTLATNDDPGDPGAFISVCCDGETQTEPVYVCHICGEEQEYLSYVKDDLCCDRCALKSVLWRIKCHDYFVDSDKVSLVLQTTFRMLKLHLQEEIDNFERKELTA